MRPDVAIIGAGYVGMPLAKAFAEAGRNVLLRDVKAEVVDGINRGESHIGDVPSGELKRLVDAGRIEATLHMDHVAEAEAILVALPTPLSSQREPDLSIVQAAVEELAPHLRKGHLVVLESTTYPGTTREVLQPILESSGLTAGDDFHLAFSPERVDPGRTDWTTHNTPKIVGGVTPACTERAAELYRGAVETVVPVSSPEAAELTKLLENIFRAVNIALVNELAQLCERMDIDVEFIELSGKINANMPYFCRSLISQALNHGSQKSLKGSRLLVLGVSYKADVDDVRESPAEKIIQLLEKAGANVAYHDPHVPEFDGMRSVEYAPEEYDGVVIVTAHTAIDYDELVERAQIVVDLRNATGRNGTGNGKVWKL
ncbi:MAG: hypothetical protein AUG91_07915 [Actinobacteria bacterium 13_1_20CM_4_69_9]|nr:MAG: hypothetical protein AUG91_07915 [Actinobacteria bacterium 13_1_20CM_4_69_9]